jgi:DNA polymerase III gamma/tau subunit
MPLEPPVLEHAIASGRVAHAYAFVGPPGSGRKAAALAFARALLKTDRDTHPDLHVTAPTPPANNPRGPLAIRIDDVRSLEHAASLTPVVGPWKVFILHDAERMTGDSPQAFLKTLEEPPPRTVIILVLSRPRAVPATVLSRCQIVRFTAAGVEPVEADRALARQMLSDAGQKGIEAVLRHAQTVERDRHRAEALLDAFWFWYRDLMRAKGGVPVPAEAAAEAERRSLDEILAGLSACREAWQALGVNVSPRLTLEVLLTRLVPPVLVPAR